MNWQLVGYISAGIFVLLVLISLIAKYRFLKTGDKTSQSVLEALGGPGVKREYKARYR